MLEILVSPCKFCGEPRAVSQKRNNVFLTLLMSGRLWDSEAAANGIKSLPGKPKMGRKEQGARVTKPCFKDSGSPWHNTSKAGNIQAWAVNSFDNLIDVGINWSYNTKYMILQVLIFPHENDYHKHFAQWHVCELVPVVSQTHYKKMSV